MTSELLTFPTVLESRGATRPVAANRKPPRVAENRVQHFLAESEWRVILHCQKLLQDPKLPVEDRRRVEGLLADAEARLRELASIQN